jgi:hypothetical protein
VDEIDPDFILFNWYNTTMPWLGTHQTVETRAKQYFIFHDIPVRHVYDKYIFLGERDFINGRVDKDNQIDPSKSVTLPRPLFNYTNPYPRNEIPNIGSFGMMTSPHKGFDIITQRVNKEFDKAVLNLHFIWSPYCDPNRVMVKAMSDLCRSLNTNPGITLNITNNLLNNHEMLDFMAKNDINVFFYKQVNQTGLSGATDYALSVNRPIAVNSAIPFKHILKDEINLDKHTIKEILELGTAPLKEYYKKWSVYEFSRRMDELFI